MPHRQIYSIHKKDVFVKKKKEKERILVYKICIQEGGDLFYTLKGGWLHVLHAQGGGVILLNSLTKFFQLPLPVTQKNYSPLLVEKNQPPTTWVHKTLIHPLPSSSYFIYPNSIGFSLFMTFRGCSENITGGWRLLFFTDEIGRIWILSLLWIGRIWVASTPPPPTYNFFNNIPIYVFYDLIWAISVLGIISFFQNLRAPPPLEDWQNMDAPFRQIHPSKASTP